MNFQAKNAKHTIVVLLLSVILNSCFLFPTGPDGQPWFAPTLEWVKPTYGAIMDVSPVGNIVSIGERTNNGHVFTAVLTLSSEGTSLRYSENAGLSKDVVANYSDHRYQCVITNTTAEGSKNYTTYLSGGFSGVHTNPYTRYNTVLGRPDAEPYPWSGYIEVVGPSIAKATPERMYLRRGNEIKGTSSWMVGTFSDKFQPDLDIPDLTDPTNWGKTTFNNSCPTFGKADCFVIRADDNPSIFYLPVRHQWGGPENDLAYDVASDDIGNATIFLRAGSDFGITSATQSLVRMKIGYNIVRLDTNGLLTETFSVSLGATGELTDTQIALGNNGAVYILAKDEQRKQYFLAKVSSSGTAWTRYLPASVSNRENSVPSNRTARMGLTVDSKDCAYITGNFSGTVDFGGASLSSSGVQAFVAKYSPNNSCLGALAMGSGLGVTVRLSPDEKSLYVNGWAVGKIMGTDIPDQNDERNGVLRPGAFLVKLKIVK